MMRLEQLKQLKILEEQLSISKAAKELFISQPALSMSLTSLESELGLLLFERTAKGLEPTDVEKGISCYIGDILQDMKQLEHLREHYGVLEEETTIVAAPECYDDVLMRMLSLKKRWPTVRVKVLLLEYGKILDSLLSGQCDIVAADYRADQWRGLKAQLKSKQLGYEVMRERDFALCLGAQDALAARQSLDGTDFHGRQLIVQRHHIAALEQITKKQRLDRDQWLVVDDEEVVKKLVVDGYGLGFGYFGDCRDDPYFTGGLLVLHTLGKVEKSVSYLVYDQQKCTSAVKNLILQYLRPQDDREMV